MSEEGVVLDSRLAPPTNTVIDGNYRLLRVTGAGAFGITYVAEDITLATIVAIKEHYPTFRTVSARNHMA